MATILIVDDLADNRKFLVTLLRDGGHRLLEAADGSEGLAAVRAEHPDLVITDVLMPVMDGYEFVRQLRLEPTTSRIPVVFYTAHYGAREARALALSSSVAYVLTKPAAVEEVLEIVDRALSGKSETGIALGASPLTTAFDREHLRLLTDKLSEHTGDLRTANARLRAMINIGLELASERDAARLLHRVCVSTRDLFGATYVTVGIVDPSDGTVQRWVLCGADTAWEAETTSLIKTWHSVSGMLATVVAEQRTMRGDNPGGDPVGLQLPPGHPEVRTYLAAPIASPARVYGWICLVGNEMKAFSEDDEQLLMALSGQVGRIYENNDLYSIARNRAEELEREIAERRQAEAAVLRERNRAQRYLDAAQVILLKLDLDGRIALVNRYGCSILGWRVDELLGRDWFETCLPPRICEAIKLRHRDLIAGDLSVAENAILTKSGEERMIEWRNTLVHDDDGHVVGTFSSGTDITERNRAAESLRVAEEQSQQAQKMEAVGRLAGGVAHDFNNLLTAILGYCELLLEGLDPGDSRQADIAEIQKAGLRGAGLTRQLLAFCRKLIIEPTLVSR
jgi:two-component system cell cycle sensor histidine kinase/response regulator CckA